MFSVITKSVHNVYIININKVKEESRKLFRFSHSYKKEKNDVSFESTHLDMFLRFFSQ